MAIKVQDLGELTYGGLVTATKVWDKNRVADGKITDKDLLKKASFHAYLIPGGLATLFSAFGVMRKQEPWLEKISTGFIYGFPGFLLDVVNAMKESGTSAGSGAVKEAQRLVNERAKAKQLGAGLSAHRSYQEEFQAVTAF